MSKSPRRNKPSPPRRNFPLQPYGNGQWGKKIRGVRRYFGPWDDPAGAEDLYNRERADWEAGRNPRLAPVVFRPFLMEIADRWLLAKKEDASREGPGSITPKTYAGCARVVERLHELVPNWHTVDPLLWSPDDWRRLRIRLGDGVRVNTLSQYVVLIRAMFNWAAKTRRIIPALPDWGAEFRNVSVEEKARDKFLHEEEHGERRFELEDARRIIAAFRRAKDRIPGFWGNHAERKMQIGSHLHYACTLIAANCGQYSADIAAITFNRLKLDDAYVHGLRTKTSVLWQAALWPETVHAIREYLEVRPAPARAEWSDLVFLTADGFPVKHESGELGRTHESDALRQATSKLLAELGLKSEGVSFGAWRHTFISLSEEFGTEGIRNRIVGHKVPGSRDAYLKLRPEQLRIVTDPVRELLLGQRTSGTHQLRLVG